MVSLILFAHQKFSRSKINDKIPTFEAILFSMFNVDLEKTHTLAPWTLSVPSSYGRILGVVFLLKYS